MYQDIIAARRAKGARRLSRVCGNRHQHPDVPRARYVDKAFFDAEIARMWPRVWQLACREEQIPEVGDCLLYESPGASILVVRSAPDEIKAFYNTCRHRGMRLCVARTRA